MRFYHKECGREVFLDFSNNFLLRAPSIGIVGGIASVSLLELDKRSETFDSSFHCSCCSQELEHSEIEISCNICEERVSLDTARNCSAFSGICPRCLEYLRGKTEKIENPPVPLRNAARWVELPEDMEGQLLSKLLTEIHCQI